MVNLQFYNSMSRSKEIFTPMEPGKAKMYTCGPTVYNFAHIGNFRAYMFEDLLRRTLEYAGYEVTQVMNLTDVDDKTIRDSIAEGLSLNDFTQKYKDAFFADIETLRIEKAEYYPAATDHIPEMIAIIEILLEKGYAYKGDDGSVYFSIAKFADYGKLAKIDMENQRSVERVKNDEYAKDSVADFALWKAWSENDGDVAWDSPWGKGRPGWHIECSAMSMKYLGKHFDLHTGGIDNMFPHHEDEIAQSEAANGCTFVNYWLHCGYLIVNGEKMSKSLGNFYTLRDLLAKGWSDREIRFVLLSTHYRKQLNFSETALEQAKNTLNTFRDFFNRLRKADGSDGDNCSELIKASEDEFTSAIADDLNVSGALAAMYSLMHDVNKLLDQKAVSAKFAEEILELYKKFDKVFAVLDVDDTSEASIPEEVLNLLEERQAARKAKDFAKSDEIRDKLNADGWIIEDSPEGPTVKKR
jgi:cysteinyl-tRNA synthetase